jgi:NAD/NADP transhydrogenase alpha subunit
VVELSVDQASDKDESSSWWAPYGNWQLYLEISAVVVGVFVGGAKTRCRKTAAITMLSACTNQISISIVVVGVQVLWVPGRSTALSYRSDRVVKLVRLKAD